MEQNGLGEIAHLWFGLPHLCHCQVCSQNHCILKVGMTLQAKRSEHHCSFLFSGISSPKSDI